MASWPFMKTIKLSFCEKEYVYTAQENMVYSCTFCKETCNDSCVDWIDF